MAAREGLSQIKTWQVSLLSNSCCNTKFSLMRDNTSDKYEHKERKSHGVRLSGGSSQCVSVLVFRL